MVKFMRIKGERTLYMTLIEIQMYLIECNPGHIPH